MTFNLIYSLLIFAIFLILGIWIYRLKKKLNAVSQSNLPAANKKSFWDNVYYNFQLYTLPILVSLSLTALLLYFLFRYTESKVYTDHQEAFKELFAISLAILSSGIFLATLKWFQFKGFFRDELNAIIEESEFETKLQKTFADVLYSDNFLKNQRDLPDLWKRVNKALFQNQCISPL